MRSKFDPGRSEITVTAIDERNVVRARAQNGSVRNDNLLAHRQVQRNVREHPRKKLAFRVAKLAANSGGASRWINLWLNEIDAPIEAPARISVDRNGRRIAWADLSDLVLKHRRIDPYL